MLENRLSNLPYSIESEQSILGSILLEPKCISEVMALIDEKDFWRDEHQKIFKAMTNLHKQNFPIDIVSVFEVLKKDNNAEFSGGMSYLAQLATSVPNAINVAYYAKIVKEKSLNREAMSLGNVIVELASSEKLDEAKEQARRVLALHQNNEIVFSETFSEEDFDKLLTLKRWTSTSIPNLSEALRFTRKEVIYIAGQTGVGKTQLAITLCMNFLEQGAKVGYLSLELGFEPLLIRLLNWFYGGEETPLWMIDLRKPEWNKVGRQLMKNPFFKDFHFRDDIYKLDDISSWIESHDLDIVFVDYVQMISVKENESRNYELGKVARELRRLSGNKCMVVLSQFNRKGGENEEDLSRMRDSGELEQTATGIVFIRRKKDEEGMFQYLVRKNQTYGLLTKWTDIKLNYNGDFKEDFKEEK